MRKHALLVAVALAALAYWLWRKLTPAVPSQATPDTAGSLGDSADADFANFVKTGTVPGASSGIRANPQPASSFAASNDPTASGSDGFNGGGGGESGGAGISRSD